MTAVGSPRTRTREPPRRRRVALLIETSMAAGRRLLAGVGLYSREHGPWTIYHEPEHVRTSLPEWLKHWRGEGIIARVRTPAMADALAAICPAVVDVLDEVADPRIVGVRVSNQEIAGLAFEHFCDRGFRRFAYCGVEGPRWSRLREEAFVEQAQRAGFACDVYRLPPRQTRAWHAEAERERLARFLAALAKPAAVLAANDLVGQRVLDGCRRADVAVPESLAVLGVDNDEALCEIASPLLSSVDPAYDQIGYRAAAALDRRMQGAADVPPESLWPPGGIAVRRSSDVLAIDDADLRAALRFIGEHACERIGVVDVVRHVALSYSTLKRRFQAVFKRTIHDEIVRVRLDRARELLTGTSLPLAAVARRTGFEHPESLGAVFKAHFGMTPGECRRRG